MDQTLKTQDDAAAAVAVAPRVTLADVEGAIAETHYLRVSDAVERCGDTANVHATVPMFCTTLCMITTKNGSLVIGKSACSSLENYNKELAEQLARRDAINRLSGFEGYLLRERLFVDGQMA
jgi:Phage protein (N4 Gp49/phage Sf6 gene 66) family